MIIILSLVYIICSIIVAGFITAYDDCDDDGDPSFGIILFVAMIMFLPAWVFFVILYWIMHLLMQVGIMLNKWSHFMCDK